MLATLPIPCPGTQGKGAGVNDKRELSGNVTRYIQKFKPWAFVIENVKGIVNKNHKPHFRRLLRSLRAVCHPDGKKPFYRVTWQVVDSRDFGLPQRRKRVYVLGSRTCPHNDKSLTPSGQKTNSAKSLTRHHMRIPGKKGLLSDYISPKRRKELFPKNATAIRNLKAGMRKLRRQGHNPQKKCCVIDLGAGKFQQVSAESLPTLTRTRCSSRAYWLTQARTRRVATSAWHVNLNLVSNIT